MIQHFSVMLTVEHKPAPGEPSLSVEPGDVARAIEDRLGHHWHETTVTVDEVVEDKPTVLRIHDLQGGHRRGYRTLDSERRAREAAEDRIDAEAKEPR